MIVSVGLLWINSLNQTLWCLYFHHQQLFSTIDFWSAVGKIRISSLLFYTSSSSDIMDLCDQYDTVYPLILDKHAPLRAWVTTLRPHAPWNKNDIREQKSIYRNLKRCWSHNGLVSSDHQSCVDHYLWITTPILSVMLVAITTPSFAPSTAFSIGSPRKS